MTYLYVFPRFKQVLNPAPFSSDAFSGAFKLVVFLMVPHLLLLLMDHGAVGAIIANVVRIVELVYNGKQESVMTHRKFSEMQFI